jgi:hypothetical protein
MEGSRPYLFDRIENAKDGTVIRSKFMASIVVGSAFVFSVVTDRKCQPAARVQGNLVRLEGVERARVIVAGVHRNFSDWDLRTVDDETRERSEKFWAQEWG